MLTVEILNEALGGEFTEHTGQINRMFHRPYRVTKRLIVIQARDTGKYNVLVSTGQHPCWNYRTLEPSKSCRVAKSELNKLKKIINEKENL